MRRPSWTKRPAPIRPAPATNASSAVQDVPPSSDFPPVIGRPAAVRVGEPVAAADAVGDGVTEPAAAVVVGLAVAALLGEGEGLSVAAAQVFVAVVQGFSKMQAWIVSSPVPPDPV